MLPKRKVGKTDIESSILIIGGHSFSDLPRKSRPADEEAVKILKFLYDNGLSHFDCTWKIEREKYNVLLNKADLKEKILPVIWHGWHDRIEKTADDIVNSIYLLLKELGVKKSGMIIINQWDHHKEHSVYYRDKDLNNPFADWFINGFLKAKSEGLTDAVGWAVEPGPLGDKYLYEIWTKIDFIAPFWNYKDMHNQSLVEFARENGIGVYSITPFRRGDDSIFLTPGIKSDEVVRPWLKWIFKEPSVFATTISLPNLKEAKAVIDALDHQPISPNEALYLRNLDIQIEWPE